MSTIQGQHRIAMSGHCDRLLVKRIGDREILHLLFHQNHDPIHCIL